ncbi:MAG: 3'-5' exonuclease [Endomicrobium sp.]|jgi:DNA polymerase-3 subunit epsilon|nr:3'-5' exonuclease [Endomicrobium sp.]
MSKIIYIDTETTGTNPVKQDVLQVAALVEIGGQIVSEFEIFCQPYDYSAIDPKALEITGFKISDIKEWHKPADAYRQFTEFLSKYVDKYNKADKFIPAGQNVLFDLEFLHSWVAKSGDKYFGSYVSRNYIDLRVFTVAARAWGLLQCENVKLETICAACGVELTAAHNAMADIKATRECLLKFRKMFEHFKETDIKQL